MDSEVETRQSVLKEGEEVLPERADNSITWKKGLNDNRRRGRSFVNLRSKTVWLSTQRWAAGTDGKEGTLVTVGTSLRI